MSQVNDYSSLLFLFRALKSLDRDLLKNYKNTIRISITLNNVNVFTFKTVRNIPVNFIR